VKLRRLPEDFLVEELAEVAPGAGDFALYRLRKRSLGTPEAIEALLRRWKLPRASVSFGGLKDRHADTVQFLTVRHGPRRGLEQENLHLEYLGQVGRPFTPGDIVGNRFAITIRDLPSGEVAHAQSVLPRVEQDGVPNYFDDQRFGSQGESGEFVARAWCLGDYDRALWLALADPNSHDRPDDREQKRTLREHWGQWDQCLPLLADSPRRDIVRFLAGRPRDFRGALARVDVDLRGLYLAAFQSALWNRMLATLLRETCSVAQLAEAEVGDQRVPFPLGLDDAQRAELHAAQLPLPTARSRHEAGRYAELMRRVVAAAGLEPHQLRVKYPRDSFFSKGNRPAVVLPRSATWQAEKDELYPRREKLRLSFELPRGSYATILIKRLFLAKHQPDAQAREDSSAGE
jgi:tRNA pseudouridine13 synthase